MVNWGISRLRPVWVAGLPSGSVVALSFALACVAFATGVRFLLGLVSPDSAVFAPYYAATLISTLVGGAAAGILAAGLGGLLACWLFIPPEWGTTPFDLQQVISIVLYLASSVVIIWVAESHRRLLQRVRDEENRRRFLNRELAHRIKNILANVQAIVSLSLRGHKDVLATVNARICALATTHDLLVNSGWQSAGLREILSGEFAPYGTSRFQIEGEEIECPSAAALALALIFHELTTNAVKYGALSWTGGRVFISWRRYGRRLNLQWIERGGPPPIARSGNGFGTRLLQTGLKPFDGSVMIRLDPAGLSCDLSLTLPEQSAPDPVEFTAPCAAQGNFDAGMREAGDPIHRNVASVGDRAA